MVLLGQVTQLQYEVQQQQKLPTTDDVLPWTHPSCIKKLSKFGIKDTKQSNIF